jgi:hypothetical protein
VSGAEISCRLDLFARNDPFADILAARMKIGHWEEWDRMETFPESISPWFVKKVRAPAGTEMDRKVLYRVAVYNKKKRND